MAASYSVAGSTCCLAIPRNKKKALSSSFNIKDTKKDIINTLSRLNVKQLIGKTCSMKEIRAKHFLVGFI